MIIPNSFQTPNQYIDRAMPYLTDSELRCLIYATRHILGWQDRIGRRRGKISLSMFERGFTTKDGTYYAGCGLGRAAIISALKTLVENGLLVRIGTADEDGQEWELGSMNIQWDKLEQRQNKTVDGFKTRTAKARAKMAEKRAGLSDNTSHVEQTTDGLSDNTTPGLSDNTESKPSSKPSSKPYSAPNGAGASQPKPRNVLFDIIAEKSFGLTGDIKQPAGGRVARILKYCKGEDVTPDELTAFYVWYAATVKAACPRDVGKFAEHFTAFRAVRVKKQTMPPVVIAPEPVEEVVTPGELAARRALTQSVRPEWEREGI